MKLYIPTLYDKNEKVTQIDFIKSLSIISVLIAHSLSGMNKYLPLYPFYIGQAVPIFMVISGISISLFIAKKINKKEKFISIYIDITKKNFFRIIAPYSFVWIIEKIIHNSFFNLNLKELLFSYITGGEGPGGYFVPIFIQHIAISPFIVIITYKYNKKINIVLFFLFSLFAEWLCVKINMPVYIYRLILVRYIYAIYIGIYISKYGVNLLLIMLSSLSILYIWCAHYLESKISIIYNSWGYQHAPSYFYTVFIITVLWTFFAYIEKYKYTLIYLGKCSYHIFLFQMIYFFNFNHYVELIYRNVIIRIIANTLICIFFGCIYFEITKIVNYSVRRIKIGSGKITNDGLVSSR